MSIMNSLKNATVTKALESIKSTYLDPKLLGIAVINKIAYESGTVTLNISLKGLEEKPFDIRMSEIKISEGGESVRLGHVECNIEFANTLLQKLVDVGFPVPDGAARVAMSAAKGLLGL